MYIKLKKKIQPSYFNGATPLPRVPSPRGIYVVCSYALLQDAFFHFFSMLLNGAYASKFETGWEP
jgi:hypothetical protein